MALNTVPQTIYENKVEKATIVFYKLLELLNEKNSITNYEESGEFFYTCKNMFEYLQVITNQVKNEENSKKANNLLNEISSTFNNKVVCSTDFKKSVKFLNVFSSFFEYLKELSRYNMFSHNLDEKENKVREILREFDNRSDLEKSVCSFVKNTLEKISTFLAE